LDSLLNRVFAINTTNQLIIMNLQFKIKNLKLKIAARGSLVCCVLLLFCLSVSALAGGLPATQPVAKPAIDINADQLEYSEQGSVIIGKGNVEVKYKSIRMTGDWCKVDLTEKKIFAKGDVTFFENKNKIHAEIITYDILSGQATVESIKGRTPPWFWDAENMERLSSEEYDVHNAILTTCPKTPPHYVIKASRMKIILDDRIWVYNAVMSFRGIPVFYTPVYAFPLKHIPYGWVIWLGHNNNDGWMTLAYYNWYVSKNLRGRVYGDYIEQRGWGRQHEYPKEGIDEARFPMGKGLDIDYRTDGGKGYFYGYQIYESKDYYKEIGDDHKDEYGVSVSDEKDDKWNRWKLYYRHKQDFGEGLYGTTKIEKLSDPDYNEDFFDEEYLKGWTEESLTRNPKTYLSLSQTWDDYYVSLLVEKRMHDFYDDVIDRLPEIDFGTRKQRIGDSSFFYKLEGSAVNLEKESDNFQRQRVDASNTLSMPRKYFGWLRIDPSVGYEETWFSEDKYGKDNVLRGVYRGDIEARTTLYKTMEVNELGEINRIRHVVEPIVGYHYRPSPQMDQNNLYYFDELDKLADLDYFDFSLINRIQIKKKHEDITRDKDNKLIKTTGYSKREIFYWNVGTKYDQNIHTTHRFTDISSDLQINATDKWGVRTESNYDMYKDELSSISGDIVFCPVDKFETSFGLRYNNDTDRHLWENSTRWEINKKWAVKAYNMYDAERSAWEKQEFSIWHNMCCWDVEFIVRTRNRSDNPDETSFFISFNLSAYKSGKVRFRSLYTEKRRESAEEQSSAVRF